MREEGRVEETVCTFLFCFPFFKKSYYSNALFKTAALNEKEILREIEREEEDSLNLPREEG